MNRTIKRLVVLISGNGSTLQSVVDATRWHTLGAEVIAVFSHEAWSYGLLRAEREGIPAVLHDLAKFRIEGKSEYEYNQALAEEVSTYNPDLVVLAGWKLALTDNFFQHFPNKIVNLKQGLPGERPTFDPYGRSPVSRAYEAYNAGLINQTHFSTQILNNSQGSGRIIAHEPVPIYDFDTLLDLEERMNRVQQDLLINTLHLLLRDNSEHEHDESKPERRGSILDDILLGEIWRFG